MLFIKELKKIVLALYMYCLLDCCFLAGMKIFTV